MAPCFESFVAYANSHFSSLEVWREGAEHVNYSACLEREISYWGNGV